MKRTLPVVRWWLWATTTSLGRSATSAQCSYNAKTVLHAAGLQPHMSATQCGICGSMMSEAFRATVLERYEACYVHCGSCGLLQAHSPHWLEHAYSEAITRADTGLVQRNLKVADRLTAVLYRFFDKHGRFLDLAGGTGLLVRLMRDRGFDCYWEDPYCSNVHAVGFGAAAEDCGFEAASAFEALEHMVDPMAFLAAAVARTRTRTLVFTTELHAGAPPPPDWWYYAFPTGQHIAFFSPRALEVAAQRLGCRFYSDGFLHTITARPMNMRVYRRAQRWARRFWIWRARQAMDSLTETDHRAALAAAGMAPPA
jgi:hypothetical protein